MSSKPENTWIAGLHKHLDTAVYHEKMANPWRGGTPDVWYSGDAADIWIEYKYVAKLPPRANLVPALSELQLEWLTKRHAQGRPVSVVVGVGLGRAAQGIIFSAPSSWRKGFSPSECAAALLPRAEIARLIISYCSKGLVSCSTSSCQLLERQALSTERPTTP